MKNTRSPHFIRRACMASGAIMAAALLSSPAQAQTVNAWIDPGEGWWWDADWSLGHIPTASEEALINGYSVLAWYMYNTAVAARLTVGSDGHSGTLRIAGHVTLATHATPNVLSSFIGIGGTGSVMIDGEGHDNNANWDNHGTLHIGMAGSAGHDGGSGELRVVNLGRYNSTGSDGIILGGLHNNTESIGSIHIGGAYQGAAEQAGILNTPRILGAPTGEDGSPNFLRFNHTATAENPYHFTRNGHADGGHIDIGTVGYTNIQVVHTAGHTVLSGTNLYTQGTVINGGVLEITQQSSLGANTLSNGIHLDGGTLQIGGTQSLTTAQSVTLGSSGGTINVVDENIYLTLDATLTGSSTLTKQGDGTLEFHAGAELSGLTVAKGNVSLTGGASTFQSVTLNAGTALVVTDTASAEFVSLNGAATTALLGSGDIRIRAGNFGGLVATTDIKKTTSGTLILSGEFRQSVMTVDAGLLTMSGPITNESIIVVNDGLVHLTGTNSSGATVTLEGGETFISGAMSDKTLNEKTQIIQNGGVLILTSSDNTFTGGLTINNGEANVGTGEPGPGNTGSFGNGPIMIGATSKLAYYLDSDTTLLGELSGSGVFETARLGTVTLSGADTFNGALKLTSGGVNLNLTETDMTLSSLEGSGHLQLGLNSAAQTLHLDQSGNTTFDGGISGPGSFTKLGAGTLVLTGESTYLGATTIHNGTLEVRGSSGSITHPSGSLTVGSTSDEHGTLVIAQGGKVTSESGVIGNGAGSTGHVMITGPGSELESATTLSVGSSGSGLVILTDSGKLSVQDGAGTVVLGQNTGGSGTLSIGGVPEQTPDTPGVLNASLVTNGEGTGKVVFNHTGNDYYFTSTGTSSGAAIQITGNTQLVHESGTTTLTGANSYTGTGETHISGGNLILSDGGSLSSPTSDFYVGYHGTASLTVSSGSTVTAKHTYLGRFSGDAGDLSLNGSFDSTSLTVGYQGTGALVLGAGGVLSTANDTIYLGHSSGSNGTLHFGDGGVSGTTTANTIHGQHANGGGTVNFNHTGEFTLDAALTGHLAVIKNGEGTTTLTGTNTYTRTTTIHSGTLAIGTGGSLTGTSDIMVATGATFDVTAASFTLGATQTLSGSGTILGGLTVAGTLAPGNSPGLMTFDSGLTLEETATLVMELGGYGRGVTYDAIDVAGDLIYGGTLSIDFINGFTPILNDSFQLFGGGFEWLTGTFANIVFADIGYTGSFDYALGTLTITAVPEPATWALLIGTGALALIFLRRRTSSRREG